MANRRGRALQAFQAETEYYPNVKLGPDKPTELMDYTKDTASEQEEAGTLRYSQQDLADMISETLKNYASSPSKSTSFTAFGGDEAGQKAVSEAYEEQPSNEGTSSDTPTKSSKTSTFLFGRDAARASIDFDEEKFQNQIKEEEARKEAARKQAAEDAKAASGIDDRYRPYAEQLDNAYKARPAIVRILSAAREEGDLSENAGYTAAKEALALHDSKIKELESNIREGKVAPEPPNEDLNSPQAVRNRALLASKRRRTEPTVKDEDYLFAGDSPFKDLLTKEVVARNPEAALDLVVNPASEKDEIKEEAEKERLKTLRSQGMPEWLGSTEVWEDLVKHHESVEDMHQEARTLGSLPGGTFSAQKLHQEADSKLEREGISGLERLFDEPGQWDELNSKAKAAGVARARRKPQLKNGLPTMTMNDGTVVTSQIPEGQAVRMSDLQAQVDKQVSQITKDRESAERSAKKAAAQAESPSWQKAVEADKAAAKAKADEIAAATVGMTPEQASAYKDARKKAEKILKIKTERQKWHEKYNAANREVRPEGTGGRVPDLKTTRKTKSGRSIETFRPNPNFDPSLRSYSNDVEQDTTMEDARLRNSELEAAKATVASRRAEREAARENLTRNALKDPSFSSDFSEKISRLSANHPVIRQLAEHFDDSDKRGVASPIPDSIRNIVNQKLNPSENGDGVDPGAEAAERLAKRQERIETLKKGMGSGFFKINDTAIDVHSGKPIPEIQQLPENEISLKEAFEVRGLDWNSSESAKLEAAERIRARRGGRSSPSIRDGARFSGEAPVTLTSPRKTDTDVKPASPVPTTLKSVSDSFAMRTSSLIPDGQHEFVHPETGEAHRMTITDGKPETTGDMGKDIENIKAWSSELVKQTQGYAGPESRVGPFQEMFGKTQDTQDQIASTIRMNDNETVMKPSAVLANLTTAHQQLSKHLQKIEGSGLAQGKAGLKYAAGTVTATTPGHELVAQEVRTNPDSEFDKRVGAIRGALELAGNHLEVARQKQRGGLGAGDTHGSDSLSAAATAIGSAYDHASAPVFSSTPVEKAVNLEPLVQTAIHAGANNIALPKPRAIGRQAGTVRQGTTNIDVESANKAIDEANASPDVDKMHEITINGQTVKVPSERLRGVPYLTGQQAEVLPKGIRESMADLPHGQTVEVEHPDAPGRKLPINIHPTENDVVVPHSEFDAVGNPAKLTKDQQSTNDLHRRAFTQYYSKKLNPNAAGMGEGPLANRAMPVTEKAPSSISGIKDDARRSTGSRPPQGPGVKLTLPQMSPLTKWHDAVAVANNLGLEKESSTLAKGGTGTDVQRALGVVNAHRMAHIHVNGVDPLTGHAASPLLKLDDTSVVGDGSLDSHIKMATIAPSIYRSRVSAALQGQVKEPGGKFPITKPASNAEGYEYVPPREGTSYVFNPDASISLEPTRPVKV
jgi:hypothetical protein